MPEILPLPETEQALKMGCICKKIDEDEKYPLYMMYFGCPVHGPKIPEKIKEDNHAPNNHQK